MLSALALASVLYTVKSGDTLSGVAQHYNTTWEAIYDANSATIHNPNLVYVGQQIRVPEGDLATSVVPAQASAPQSSSSPSSVHSTPAKSYRVTPAQSSAPAQSRSAQSTETQGASTQGTSGTASSGGSGSSSGALDDIPGVPSSFAACVAYRESTNDTNPAAHGNAYGIIPASGYNVSGDSLAQQKQVFKEIYDTTGPSAWSADGCA